MNGNLARAVTNEARRLARKRFGVYYTPSPVADFLVRWAVRSDREVVLEPAAGNGEFLESLIRTERALTPPAAVIAVEIDPDVASLLETSYPAAKVIRGDFLALGAADVPRVDVVVGNPPFVRYQSLSRDDRDRGQRLAKDSQVDLSRLASSWAHFVIHAASFLREKNGRLAVVVPAEILQTRYGMSVRAFLQRRFRSVTYVTIDQRVFDDAQVDAVLLLADQSGPTGSHRVQVSTVEALDALDVARSRRATKSLADRPALSNATHDLYATLLASTNLTSLGALADIDIGVVTGASHFFILDEAARAQLRLIPPYVSPIVRRARDVAGICASPEHARWLFSSVSDEDPAVASYVARGLSLKVNEGYKCSIREVWHNVPIPVARPDFLLPAMHHRSPKLIHNPGRLLASNLLYFVDTRSPRPLGRWLAAAALSSPTALSGEIEGRTYGGGVLKLEPSEAERLLIPKPSAAQRKRLSDAFPALDVLISNGRWQEARSRVDRILGFDTELLGHAADELRARRLRLRRRRGLTGPE